VFPHSLVSQQQTAKLSCQLLLMPTSAKDVSRGGAIIECECLNFYLSSDDESNYELEYSDSSDDD
jgi:hypothetical protein